MIILSVIEILMVDLFEHLLLLYIEGKGLLRGYSR